MRKTAVWFVLLLIAASVSCNAAKRGLPEPVIPECLGVNIHFVGDNDEQVKMIAEAGFRLIRMDFIWEAVEKEKGKYDFSQYDGLMAALDRYGIRPLFILDYDNPNYPNSTVPSSEEAVNAFAAFAGAGAAHFRDRGIIWEVWNEPNYRGFQPNVYANMALAAAKAVHEADPTATVVGPALATIDIGFLDGILKSGVLDGFQAITVHPYRGSPPETTTANYESVRKLISRYAPDGKEVPILSGEWGYTMTSVSAEQQAQYLTRMFLNNLACDVNFSIWYDWSDDGTDPNYGEHHFGTVYIDLKPKPAYLAMQTLAKQLAGYRFVSKASVDNPDDYVLIFKNGNRYKLAAWTMGESHEISLPMDVSPIVLANMYGKRKPGLLDDGCLKLQLTQSVTYVDVLGDSKRLAIEENWSASAEAGSPLSPERVSVRYRIANPLNEPLKATVSFFDAQYTEQIASRHISIAPGDILDSKAVLEVGWDGAPSLGAVVEIKVDGIDGPFHRSVSFDTSQFLTVTTAPPLGDSIPVYVHNPSGQPFSGIVRIKSGDTSADTPVSLAKGQAFAEVICAIAIVDPDDMAIGVELLNSDGKPIYSPGSFTFKLAAPFNDGSKVSVVMDGNGGVPVSTTQTTAPPPEMLPDVESCVKIDYGFGNGWRYARFNFDPITPIEDKPLFAGVWVYGDGSDDWLVTRLRDATNQCLQSAGVKMDFKGWRFVTWSLVQSRLAYWEGANDGIIHWPMRWDSQFILDSNQKEHSGTVYVGPMWLAY